MEEILNYKKELFHAISMESDSNEVFPEESFFEYVSEQLSSAGILDNVQYCPYRNSRRGIRLDGYSWNELERTICGIVVNFTNDAETVDTLTNTEIGEIGKRVSRFFDIVGDAEFLSSLEVTDPGRNAAEEMEGYIDQAIKYRVVIFTDQILSSRVKKLSVDEIRGTPTSIEIWDLQRLEELENSDSEYEEFTVNLDELGGGIRALPANVSEEGASTYLAVMPGQLLSAIYDEFGQRLLESNVRTFLDFRANTNRGMRKSLLTEPEHFFAYNNGITVTATAIETRYAGDQLLITSLENMQVVNGGQTTAAIYFSPREKGGIKGAEGTRNYREIDLNKVHVQMKLTVIEDKEAADIIKSKIATFANSQNSIQQSDLVSNHPFHLNLETRSRKQLMPAKENQLPTKWFYERARGQYTTQLRALGGVQRRKFEEANPKRQVFTKTDMAKYENTWRMKPYVVKKGAQANLKALGAEIIKEFEKDELSFGPAFYNDLVAKMILFRDVDSAVLNAGWYREERGLKAEVVTYSIALVRSKLLLSGQDINLSLIFKRQNASDSLLGVMVETAKKVRESITDLEFTGGVSNPSEFCKSERGWKRIQSLDVDLDALTSSDIRSPDEVANASAESRKLNQASKTIGGFDYVMSVAPEEWDGIAEFNSTSYPSAHINVSIPRMCAGLHRGGRLPSTKQMDCAKRIREEAYSSGFDFIAS